MARGRRREEGEVEAKESAFSGVGGLHHLHYHHALGGFLLINKHLCYFLVLRVAGRRTTGSYCCFDGIPFFIFCIIFTARIM
jgi:hypothetical protein